jgi:hypothetical protein
MCLILGSHYYYEVWSSIVVIQNNNTTSYCLTYLLKHSYVFWYLCSSETKLCSSKETEIMGRPVFYYTIQELLSRDGVVGVATGLWTRQVGVRVPAGSIFFSSRKRPECFRAPPSLLCSRYRCYFLGCQVTRAWGWPSLRIHETTTTSTGIAQSV